MIEDAKHKAAKPIDVDCKDIELVHYPQHYVHQPQPR